MLPPVLDTRNDQGCRCFVWQIEIDDGRHPVDIDAAGGNVGGDGVGRSAPRAVSTSAPKFARLFAGASRIRTLGPTLSLGPATWVELVRLAARDRTDAAIAKPEPPFVRVDELGGQFPGMPGAPSHGQNRGLAVSAADQAPRACDSAHGLTGK
jgi:hypothetical protein